MNKNLKFPFWNQELEQVVGDFIKSVQTENTKDFGWSWTRPLANIVEKPEALEIQLAAPGLTKSDFNLSIDDKILKVEVNKTKSESDSKKIKTEFSYEKFSRHFKISDDVNKEAIKAAYEQGILIITLPRKADSASTSKKINVL